MKVEVLHHLNLFCVEHLVKAKLELSENQSGTLNECKRKAKHEFSERDKS
jgi:hypothetical protein